MSNNEIVQKLWNLCDVLRDDGINYSDYVTELVLLLFIKMDYEQAQAEVKFDHKLPNILSHRVGTVDALCGTVKSIVNGELGPLNYQERRKHLDPHIASLEGPLAADRIVDALEQGGYRERKPPASPLGNYSHGWLHNRLRTVVKHINMRRPGHRNNLTYHAHRWPDISVAEVKDRIARLGRLLNRFDGLRVEPYSQHIFKISQ